MSAHAGSHSKPLTVEDRLALLEDERDIRGAIERYSHMLDANRAAEWVDCFTADGIFDMRMPASPSGFTQMFPYGQPYDHGLRFVGHATLEKLVAGWTAPPRKLRRHVVTDLVIARDDANTARATSYFLLVRDTDGSRAIASFGNYLDRLKRCEDGRWRFTERIADMESL